MGRLDEISPRLWSFLAIQLTVDARDEEATRQALRRAAETLEEKEAMRTVRLLERTMTATSRRWLMGLVS